jgi:hypothetical protein
MRTLLQPGGFDRLLYADGPSRARTFRPTPAYPGRIQLAVTSLDGAMVTRNGTAAGYSSPPMT